MIRFHFTSLLSCLGWLTFGSSALWAGKIDFAQQVRPILNSHCVACHGGVKEAADVSFIYRDKALAVGESGKLTIVPGNPEVSEMMVRILSEDPAEVMPKPNHGPPLPASEVAILKQWIQEGAEWGEHWSFVKPQLHPAPKVKQTTWPRREMDYFILSRLEHEGLKPANQATKNALLRRASLDLIGLPPTPDELESFEQDTSVNAYEKQIDRLLSSPHFGERWASVWMDLARYADSEGLGLDLRRDVWKYRDWVVQAFNDDMPFDQFTIEQLAGDLIPHATLDQRIATTFHRLSQANNEGGTDDEEFRVAAVMDRVATTWEVWQGVTMGCVQCHSHPYDPIKHEEYFSFMDFFNHTVDADLVEGLPLLKVPVDRNLHATAGALQNRIRALEENIFTQQEAHKEESTWLPSQGMKPAGKAGKLQVIKQGDLEEYRTIGNIAVGDVHELNIPVQAGLKSLTAFKLEVLPLDEEKALHTPEWGSIIRRFSLQIVKATGQAQEVALQEVITDEAHPNFDPNGSLKDSERGWGPYSKISRARHAVVLLKKPLVFEKGDSLRLSLAHTKKSLLSSFVLVSKRGRVFLTDSPAWSDYQQSPGIARLKKELNAAREELKKLRTVTTPYLQELETGQRRATHVFVRGNWLDKGELIKEPNTPAIFPKLQGQHDRLSMAKWLVSDDNPLTSRVAVNRLWLELFGVGIVPTPEDFGSAGEKPTHPELLDTLSIRFQSDMKWSVKSLLRELVTSAAYQQDATITAQLHERDADNRLLARGPRQRLTGEMIRDHALTVSGLLANDQGGPPVHPPLPADVWQPFTKDPWNTPREGERNRYRRSIYVYWKRSIPYPMFGTFDAPTRELCNKRRVTSNTPLQALTVLNDPTFAEFSRAFGLRIKDEFTGDLDAKLSLAYFAATSQKITPARLSELRSLYAQLAQQYHREPQSLNAFAGSAEHATLTVIASVLFNLDEALIR